MCYDTWKTTHPDDLYIDPYEDYVHIDELAKYEEAADYLKDMIRQVYEEGNVTLFEDALEDLAAIFDINLPKKAPKIEKKRSELFDFAVGLTQDYATAIAHEGEIL